jgi:dUTPase
MEAGMKIEIKKLSDTAVLPVRGSAQAAGYDLCADGKEPLVIAPGETVKVGWHLPCRRDISAVSMPEADYPQRKDCDRQTVPV